MFPALAVTIAPVFAQEIETIIPVDPLGFSEQETSHSNNINAPVDSQELDAQSISGEGYVPPSPDSKTEEEASLEGSATPSQEQSTLSTQSSEGEGYALVVQTPKLTPIQEVLKRKLTALTNGVPQQLLPLSKAFLKETAAFYQDHGYTAVWLQDGSLTQNAQELREALRSAGTHGLSPADYAVSYIDDLEGALNQAGALEQAGELELLLTKAYLRFAKHLTSGRVNPRKVDRENDLSPAYRSPEQLLAPLASDASMDQILADLAPQDPAYKGLQRQLALHLSRQPEEQIQIPSGKSLKPGMTSSRVELVRKRLGQEKYYVYDGLEQTVYTGDIIEAVKEFQRRNGLADDGVVGKATLAALNTGPQQHVELIRNNLERLRWYNKPLGRKYVDVNIAAQTASIVQDGLTIYQTRAVVGKPKFSTPIFSDQISYAEVNPYWNVPRSIAVNEHLPTLQQDPLSLARKGIRVFRGKKEIDPRSVAWNQLQPKKFNYFFRQDPGRGNALGKVKYMFPNKHSIYLHDTPSKSLFNRDVRAFSHGCIRLKDPFTFGEVLFTGEPAAQTRLYSTWRQQKNKVIRLQNKIPVYLRYITAWEDDNGQLQVRKDIYGKDKKLNKALERAYKTTS